MGNECYIARLDPMLFEERRANGQIVNGRVELQFAVGQFRPHRLEVALIQQLGNEIAFEVGEIGCGGIHGLTSAQGIGFFFLLQAHGRPL